MNDICVQSDYVDMEAPRLRRLMQQLHSIEAGNVNPSDVIQSGWTHALSAAYILRVGRTTNQCLKDYHKYEEAQEVSKAVCEESAEV